MLVTKRKADRIVLNNMSWEQFESLLTALGNKRAARITYNREIIEIMTPLPEYELLIDVKNTRNKIKKCLKNCSKMYHFP